jgi:hypothetical protein
VSSVGSIKHLTLSNPNSPIPHIHIIGTTNTIDLTKDMLCVGWRKWTATNDSELHNSVSVAEKY